MKLQLLLCLDRCVMVAMTAMLLAACGQQKLPVENSQVQTKSVQGVIPEHQLKALKDAKAIEKVMQDAASERLKETNE